jgi:hypothetical protein
MGSESADSTLPPAADPLGSSRIWSLREARALLAFMGLGGDDGERDGDHGARYPSEGERR